MGVPLLAALLGAQAAGPTILTMMIDMIIITSLCIALSRLDGGGFCRSKRVAGACMSQKTDTTQLSRPQNRLTCCFVT